MSWGMMARLPSPNPWRLWAASPWRRCYPTPTHISSIGGTWCFSACPEWSATYAGAWLAHFVPAAVQLTFFAVIMLAAAVLMLRGTPASRKRLAGSPEQIDKPTAFWLIALVGMAVGVVTGLVGVGGGFLIVPALVIFGKLPMKVAVGTSLTVIAFNSLSGFWKYSDVLASIGASINWNTVAAFVLLGIVGSFTGHRLAIHLNQQVLRRSFAVFLLAMGSLVLVREAPKALNATPPETSVVGQVDVHFEPLLTLRK